MGSKEKWQQLAVELGFEFKTGIRAFLESPTVLKLFEGRQLPKNPALLQNPMVQMMIEKVFMGTVTGFYRKFEFYLLRGSKGSSSTGGGKQIYYVSVVLLFKNPLGTGLEIRPASFFSSIGKMLMPRKYLKIPNKELEQLITAKGKNKNQISVHLYDPKFQEMLLKLFRFSKDFKITDEGIRYEQDSDIIDKNHALEVMDLMATAAEYFLP